MEHHLHFFLHYPQNHSVRVRVSRLGVGTVDKHVADIAQKHVADRAYCTENGSATIGLSLYLTYMAEMA